MLRRLALAPEHTLDVSPFGALGFQPGVDGWRAFDARSGPIEESDPLAIAPCSFVVAVGSHERLLRRNRRADLRGDSIGVRSGSACSRSPGGLHAEQGEDGRARDPYDLAGPNPGA